MDDVPNTRRSPDMLRSPEKEPVRAYTSRHEAVADPRSYVRLRPGRKEPVRAVVPRMERAFPLSTVVPMPTAPPAL